MAIKSDATLSYSKGGKKGLETARGIGLLTYRTPNSYNQTQPRKEGQITQFSAASYIQYQGKKLADRFSPHSYLTLINCLDTHDISRNRKDLQSALNKISSKTLCIGIKEDLLADSELLRSCTDHIPLGHFEEINSPFGHDGFLIETNQLANLIRKYFN